MNLFDLAYKLNSSNKVSMFLSTKFLNKPKKSESRHIVSFLAPNEMHIMNAKELYQKVRDGVFISVGTERSFMALGMTKADYALFIDRDISVVSYNRYVIGLLTLADNINDFRYLKNTATFEEILARTNHCNHRFSYGVKKELKDRDSYKLFKNAWNTRIKYLFNKNSVFKDFNYLYNNDRFKRLSFLAKQGRIESQFVNLNNHRKIGNIVYNLKTRGLSVSLFDISNAWTPTYKILKLSNRAFITEDIDNLFLSFKRVATENTIFVMTYYNYRTEENPNLTFNYFSISYDNYLKFYQSKNGTNIFYRYMYSKQKLNIPFFDLTMKIKQVPDNLEPFNLRAEQE